MYKRIVLPRILGFRVKGFQPIFISDVEMVLNQGPFIILGGNGLGKTTLIQAVVYGLAGGSNNENIEENKVFRWDHGYFRERLSTNPLTHSVEVEVDFSFGDKQFSVRRGFRGTNVIGFREGTGEWIEKSPDAQNQFNNCLSNIGGYRSEIDFAFIVHRLLYLSESRQLIAWDIDTQVRILMLLNQDVISADDFRERRKRLKEMDSRRRHVHVALGQAEQQISSLMEYDENKIESEEILTVIPPDKSEPKKEIGPLVAQLEPLNTRLNSLSRQKNDIAEDLSKVSIEIDEYREQIEQTEGELINNFLKDEEQEQNLAIHKLLVNGICPVCGIQQYDLREIAQANNQNHRCVICGSEETQETNPDLMTLRSQLAEKIRSQKAYEKEYFNVTNQLNSLQEQVDTIRQQINEIGFQNPVVNLAERHLPEFTQENLVNLKNSLINQEADLLFRISEEKRILSQNFQSFRESIENRISNLRSSYQNYATKFLGLDCELSEKPLTIAPSDIPLSQFIPFFENTIREKPDSCSEAQRFFLDIAFRMALIEFGSTNNNEKATFICETPENALDISYVDNVAHMFEVFCKTGSNILLTANIQQNGLAQRMLKAIPTKEKSEHIINMLKIGRLSNVQLEALPLLEETISSILN